MERRGEQDFCEVCGYERAEGDEGGGGNGVPVIHTHRGDVDYHPSSVFPDGMEFGGEVGYHHQQTYLSSSSLLPPLHQGMINPTVAALFNSFSGGEYVG